METLEELKAIRDNAPDGATHISEFVHCYVKLNVGYYFWWDGDAWYPLDGPLLLRSLSDINRIIELMEINEAMHKQVAGYLAAADWQHWQNFNKSKFEVMK